MSSNFCEDFNKFHNLNFLMIATIYRIGSLNVPIKYPGNILCHEREQKHERPWSKIIMAD